MTVVILSVQEYPIKPIAFLGRYYQRKGNSNHQMNVAEVADMYLASTQYSWDAFPYSGGSIKDLDTKKIDEFIEKVNRIGRFNLQQNHKNALAKLRLLKNDTVTNAAMILFSEENLFYNVHIGRFKTPTHIIADYMINGNLYEVISKSMEVIVSHLKFAFEITGEKTQRNEIPEYPLDAIRELLLNALVHRDYAHSSDVIIKIFDQSIRFANASGLYGNISIEDLHTDNYQASTRNKLLAEALYLTNDIEKYGSGFNRIRQAILSYPTMRFSYEETSNAFVAELHYTEQKVSTKTTGNKLKDKLKDKLKEELPQREKQIVKEVVKRPTITQKELSDILGITPQNVRVHINRLKEKGLLKRVGGRKLGCWEVYGGKS